MSYVLDAGRQNHGLESLAESYIHPRGRSTSTRSSRPARRGSTFDAVGIEQATDYAAEKADVTLRLWQVLKPRLAAERVLAVYETLERPLLAVLARMERRGISIDREVLSRLSGEFAQEAAGLEAEIKKDRRRGQSIPGSPKQLGDVLVRQARTPRRHQDQDRPMVDRRARARRPRRAGPRAAAENPRLAAGLEAEIDLHRRAARLRQSDDPPRPHQLRARRDHDRTPLVVRSESAEHPDPHRGRPQNPPRLHCRAGHEARLRRLFADRAAAARRDRRHRAAAEGVPRRPRHPRHDRLGDVRRADQGHAGRDPPPRQGDQFRHRLRHFRLRPRQSAWHSARGSRRLHQEILRAFSRHPRLHRGDRRPSPRSTAMC